MASASSQDRPILFDDFILSFYKIKILQRKTPDSPYKVHELKYLAIPSLLISQQLVVLVLGALRISPDSKVYVDISRLSVAGALGSGFMMAYIRELFLIFKHKQIDILLEGLERLFPRDLDTQRKQKMFEYSKMIIQKNKVIKFLYILVSVLFLLQPIVRSLYIWLILGKDYPILYPFIDEFPFDVFNWTSYFLLYTVQAGSCISGVLFLFIDDMIFTTVVTQMCIYYRYLGKCLSEIDARDEAQSNQRLKELVQYQTILQGLTEQINNVFSMSTFIGFTIVKISLCLFMYSLLYNIDMGSSLPFASAFVVLFYPVYIRCMFGTELYTASSDLVYAIYDQNWYEGTSRYRKMVAIMLMRANKPEVLKASQLRHVQMEYFKEIISEAYQIFMFLHKFSKRE